MQPIAIYHEHPDWFKPLFTALERRGLPHVRVDASHHLFDPAEDDAPYSLVVNRASPSAYLRGHRQATFHTLHWLRHLERVGIPVVNGSKVYGLELSKASQLDLLEELGLPYPKARAINHPSLAVEAASTLRYPVLVKANIGGSGAGIIRYDSEVALAGAVARCEVELRVDGYTPPPHIIEQVERISRRASLDIGGIEYLVDDRDGEHYFNDINALSNFVADAPNVIGFDPWERFVDYIARRVPTPVALP